MKKLLVLGAFVALLAMLVTPLAVFAESTPTPTPAPVTIATGTVSGPSIVVTAPVLPAFGNFVAGINKVASSTDGTVIVTPGSDGNTAWTVTAKDVAGGGYMWLGGTISGTRLTNKFQISPDNWATWAYADDGITYSGSSATGTLPLYGQQVIASTDTAPGSYSITITFTGTCTP